MKIKSEIVVANSFAEAFSVCRDMAQNGREFYPAIIRKEDRPLLPPSFGFPITALAVECFRVGQRVVESGLGKREDRDAGVVTHFTSDTVHTDLGNVYHRKRDSVFFRRGGIWVLVMK